VPPRGGGGELDGKHLGQPLRKAVGELSAGVAPAPRPSMNVEAMMVIDAISTPKASKHSRCQHTG
jgi:hypothetical protein